MHKEAYVLRELDTIANTASSVLVVLCVPLLTVQPDPYSPEP
jgi:hypothetical protein